MAVEGNKWLNLELSRNSVVYINDLADDVKWVKVFSDDTPLLAVVEGLNSAAIDMNHDSELIR